MVGSKMLATTIKPMAMEGLREDEGGSAGKEVWKKKKGKEKLFFRPRNV